MSEKLIWKSMVNAPRDGSVILVLHTDASGVIPVFWGEFEPSNPPKVNDFTGEGWFNAFDRQFESSFDDWAGWIEAPQNTKGWIIK